MKQRDHAMTSDTHGLPKGSTPNLRPSHRWVQKKAKAVKGRGTVDVIFKTYSLGINN